MNKKLGGGIIAVIVVIGIKLAIGLGLGSGIGFLGAKASAPDVGECVSVKGTADKADVDTKPCGKDTLWKVASSDGKCDEMETNYYVEVTGAKAVNLCLEHDVAVGECIEVSTGGANAPMDKQVACSTKPGASTVVVKVTKLDTTSADVKCGKQEIALPNVTRKTSMCVGDPAA